MGLGGWRRPGDAEEVSMVLVLLLLQFVLLPVNSELLASCPAEQSSAADGSAYRIGLDNLTMFSVHSNGSCSCGRFSGSASEMDLSTNRLVQDLLESVTELKATVRMLNSSLQALSAWGLFNASCETDLDCRRPLVCEPGTRRCKSPVGSPCSSSVDCLPGLQCLHSVCMGPTTGTTRSTGSTGSSGSTGSTGTTGVRPTNRCDEISGATITGLPVLVHFSTLGATQSSVVPAPDACLNIGRDVWFSVWLPANTSVTFSLCPQSGGSATFDTVIVGYSHTPSDASCLSFQSVGCNTDCCGQQSQLTVAPRTSASFIAIRIGGLRSSWIGGFAPYGTGVLSVFYNNTRPIAICNA